MEKMVREVKIEKESSLIEVSVVLRRLWRESLQTGAKVTVEVWVEEKTKEVA